MKKIKIDEFGPVREALARVNATQDQLRRGEAAAVDLATNLRRSLETVVLEDNAALDDAARLQVKLAAVQARQPLLLHELEGDLAALDATVEGAKPQFAAQCKSAQAACEKRFRELLRAEFSGDDAELNDAVNSACERSSKYKNLIFLAPAPGRIGETTVLEGAEDFLRRVEQFGQLTTA